MGVNEEAQKPTGTLDRELFLLVTRVCVNRRIKKFQVSIKNVSSLMSTEWCVCV